MNTAGVPAGVYYGSLGDRFQSYNVAALRAGDVDGFGHADLRLSPNSLVFAAQPAGTAPTQTIAVAGSSAIPFTVTSVSSWLTVSPSSGTTPGSVTVTATPGASGAGQYQANVVITSGGDTAQAITVPVSLYISSTATPVISAITDALTYLHQYGAPGAIMAVWGQGLGPATPAQLQLANPTTLATTVAGTQVLADGIPCPILFTSSGQVNVVLPFSLDGATTTQVQLIYQGVASNTITLPIQPAVPGIFSLDATGQNGGAILNQDLERKHNCESSTCRHDCSGVWGRRGLHESSGERRSSSVYYGTVPGPRAHWNSNGSGPTRDHRVLRRCPRSRFGCASNQRYDPGRDCFRPTTNRAYRWNGNQPTQPLCLRKVGFRITGHTVHRKPYALFLFARRSFRSSDKSL